MRDIILCFYIAALLLLCQGCGSLAGSFYSGQGQHRLIKKEYAEAVVFFDKSISSHPAKDNAAYSFRAQAYLEIAKQSVKEKNLKKAYESVDKILTDHRKDNIDPAYLAKAYCLRGAILSDIGKPREGLEDLTEAISLAPDKSEYYYLRGKLYKGMKEEELSCKDFAKAKELNPSAGRDK